MKLPLNSLICILKAAMGLTLILLALGSKADSKSQPNPIIFEATYKAKISGIGATLVRRLKQSANGQYLLHSRASNFFAYIDETSLFRIDDKQVKVQSYQYERSIAGKKSIESLHFDWSSMTGVFSRDDDDSPTELALKANTLDPAVYQLFLQADVSSNNETLKYSFIKRKRMENYTFEALADEKLDIGGKTYTCKVFERKDDHQVKETKVWIVPALDFQIGKIEHTNRKGRTYGMSLQSYEADKERLKRFYQNARAINNSTPNPKLQSPAAADNLPGSNSASSQAND